MVLMGSSTRLTRHKKVPIDVMTDTGILVLTFQNWNCWPKEGNNVDTRSSRVFADGRGKQIYGLHYNGIERGIENKRTIWKLIK